MESHQTKYTYYKNGVGTFSICAPTSVGLNYISLAFKDEFLANEIVDELNKAIQFGYKLGQKLYTKEDQDRDREAVLNYDFIKD